MLMTYVLMTLPKWTIASFFFWLHLNPCETLQIHLDSRFYNNSLTLFLTLLQVSIKIIHLLGHYDLKVR